LYKLKNSRGSQEPVRVIGGAPFYYSDRLLGLCNMEVFNLGL
jgi:hypothetical protein